MISIPYQYVIYRESVLATVIALLGPPAGLPLLSF